MTDPDAISSAILLYLFADAEIPQDTAVTRAVAVPCTDARVQRRALAVELLAITLWSLREAGAVAIRHEVRKRRLLGTRDVALIAAGGIAPPSPFPLAVGLFNACGVQETDVFTAVHAWYGRDMSDPATPVIRAVEDEATRLGLFEPTQERAILGARRGDPRCDRIVALRPFFDERIGRWRDFKAAEPDLDRAIRSGISGAMRSRVAEVDLLD